MKNKNEINRLFLGMIKNLFEEDGGNELEDNPEVAFCKMCRTDHEIGKHIFGKNPVKGHDRGELYKTSGQAWRGDKRISSKQRGFFPRKPTDKLYGKKPQDPNRKTGFIDYPAIGNQTPAEKIKRINLNAQEFEIFRALRKQIQKLAAKTGTDGLACLKDKAYIRSLGFSNGVLPETIQLMLVQTDAKCFRFLANPTELVQISAIKYNPEMIRYIVDPSPRVMFYAVKTRPNTIRHIDNPPEKIQLLAIKANPLLIRAIRNPTEEAQCEAIDMNPIAFKLIDHPCEEAIELYNEINSGTHGDENPVTVFFHGGPAYVNRLSEDNVRSVFEKYGKILDIRIPVIGSGGMPRGFAFIEFANEESALNAVDDLNGKEYGGHRVTVKIDEPDEPDEPDEYEEYRL